MFNIFKRAAAFATTITARMLHPMAIVAEPNWRLDEIATPVQLPRIANRPHRYRKQKADDESLLPRGS
jgi:hypothetical protein